MTFQPSTCFCKAPVCDLRVLPHFVCFRWAVACEQALPNQRVALRMGVRCSSPRSFTRYNPSKSMPIKDVAHA
jgi:hypothetical protein